MLSFLERFQLGIDIATSVAIIGAFISWLIESRKRARAEREAGISEQARSLAAGLIQQTIDDLANRHAAIVNAGLPIEAPVRRALEHARATNTPPDETLAAYLRSHPARIQELIGSLDAITRAITDFYERVASHRYSYFPVLYALPEGRQCVHIVKETYGQILRSHGLLTGGWLGLLRSMHELLARYDTAAAANPQHSGVQMMLERFHPELQAVIFDRNYLPWIENFVPNGREADFKAELETREILDAALLQQVFANVAGHMVEHRHRLYGRLMFFSAQEIQSCRIECKEILCVLGGVMSRLLARNDAQNIQEIIDALQGEDYLALQTEVR